MIAREWRCRCPKDTCDAFIKHIYKTVMRQTQSIRGCKGAQLLRRDIGECMEITLLTYWDSLQSVIRFSGKDYERAQLHPEYYDYGIIPDHEVAHYDVVEVLDVQYIPGE